MKNHLLSKIILSSALAIVLGFVSGSLTNSSTSGQMKPMSDSEHQQMLNK